MKSIPTLLCALVLVHGTFLPGQAQTITSGVPDFISYQGRVLDNGGNPVGAGTPVNRLVTFRVWDHSSNAALGNLIYAEEQTVTIADGEFSVLIGQGVNKSGLVSSVADAFNGSERFLGVTIDDGTPAADNEISPRQQLVSSAFAFRARYAETLGTSTNTALTVLDSGNVGIGVADPLAPLVVGAGLSSSPGANGIVVRNPKPLLNEHAIINASVNGASAGDPFLSFDIGGVTGWSLGIDNSDQDKFKISNAWNSVSTETKLTIDRSGNVGVGLTAPTHKLHVNGSLGAGDSSVGALYSSGGVHVVGTRGAHSQGGYIEWNKQGLGRTYLLNQKGLGSGGVLLGDVDAADGISFGFFTRPEYSHVNGNLGVGTVPSKAKVHIEGTAFQNAIGGNNGLLYNVNPPTLYSAPATENLSLYASGPIHVGHVRVFSDQRIKSVIGVSDGKEDLQALLRLEITDYTMKDPYFKGGVRYKKVIAQQVEKVYPQAVTVSEDIIPDIYQSADIKDGWVSLSTDLKKGDRVRLVAEKETGTHEVLEVETGRFLTAFKPEGSRVFVYGREVDDFRLVDYEAIAMLNVSATQELKREKDRQIKRLQEENAALRKRLSETEERVTARLAALERLLGTGESIPVSTKPAIAP